MMCQDDVATGGERSWRKVGSPPGACYAILMVVSARVVAVALAGVLAGACELSTTGDEGTSDGAAGYPSDAHDRDSSGAAPLEAAARDASDARVADAHIPDGHVADAPVADGPIADGPVADAPVHDADSAVTDAADAGPVVITVLQHGTASSSNGTTLTANLSPTTSGSFLAVLATYGTVSTTITGVADNATSGGNTYVSADLRSVVGSCQASEIWYARDAQPGATSVTVTQGGNGNLAVWVLEVSGLRTTGGVDDGVVGTGGSTNKITAPEVTPSGAPALVIAAVGSCGNIGGIAAPNPFTALGVQNGNNAAYYVPTTVGPFGPVFNNSFNQWNASVAAFR
jgi:hypothetical protein